MLKIRDIQKRMVVIVMLLTMIISVLPVYEVNAFEAIQGEQGEEKDTLNIEDVQEDDNFSDQVQEQQEQQLSDSIQEQQGQLVEQDKSSPIIEYLYVENPYQVTPGVQKIAVSFQEGLVLSNAVLTYEKEGVDTQLEVAADEIQEDVVLFSINYTDETQSGIYHLVKVTVETNGTLHEINLDSVGINSRYGVNQECSTQPDVIVEEDTPTALRSNRRVSAEATFITLDDTEKLSENDVIEDAIDEAVDEVAVVSGRSAETASYSARSSDNLVVVLDPGHGGHDGGAAGNGAQEKNLTLKIAQYCRDELQRYNGITVYMTRDTDRYVGLTDRVNYAKQMGADVFISIHLNSTGKGTAKGAEVYYPNSSYRPDLGSQGANLAQKIQNELVALGITNRGIKIRDGAGKYSDGSVQDYYAVIRGSKLAGFPGLIIEHAFIDNANDYNRYLSSDAKLQALGRADAQGIANYFGYGKGTWKSDKNGWKFEYLNGTNPANQWDYIEGYWYYFGANGYILTDFQTIGGAKYYFENTGKMKIGWLLLGKDWYYFDVSGAMQTGWLLLDGTWYYLAADGKMQTGWQTIGGKKYYLDSQNGYMAVGWKKLGKDWYYFNDSGYMTTGWQWVNGKCYYMDDMGVMLEDTWIGNDYVDGSGAWIPDKKKPEQEPVGWILSGNRWRFRYSDGTYAKSGWKDIDGKRYYFDAAGWMLTGWQWVDGKCYYLDDSGALIKDKWVDNYYVDENGVWIPGKERPAEWILSGNRWWYRHSDGSYTKSNWEKINGKWYYFDAAGWMLTGWQWVNGKCYYLYDSGAMAEDTWIGEYYVDGSGAWIPEKKRTA
ncbi:N-acetylmuramoyl-L-alanine amidase family protein [Sporofaciens musculi]|jgi:glucan-binding YG repeat protein|uniref:N-acetylmuramoyl-L-alanine amidase family protein n=1 Tax=Sporofaciens musculi TaxID=2681861 RepID=UPI0025A277BB|nr:N-acetylmuramoyl-L-alanine amidase [Sporofaciens musculi]